MNYCDKCLKLKTSRMAASGGRFLTSLFSALKVNVGPNVYSGSLMQTRNYAARKGTRERKLKLKKKNIEIKAKKLAAMGPMIRKKNLRLNPPDILKYRESNVLRISPDDVWISRYYNWKVYPFEEAVQCHREVLHPTMYNVPHAVIKANIELNMEGLKKNKPMGAFHDLVAVPHKFEQGGEHRTILAFAKTPEQQQEARDAGATLVAGTDIIRLIRIGEMSIADFHAIVAHPSILADLLGVKGIMKRKFPTLKLGTLGTDLKTMIYKHLYGIKYSATPEINYPSCGSVEIPFGTLDMETKQLEENFKAMIDSIQSHKPKRPGPFITRIRLKCLPNKEQFKIDHTAFIEEEPILEEDEDEDEDTVAKAEI